MHEEAPLGFTTYHAAFAAGKVTTEVNGKGGNGF